MGWTFTPGQSKGSLIAERIAKQEYKGTAWETLAHCLRGNCLWKVIQVTKADGTKLVFIALDLLENGGKDNGWGYKDMDESVHPYYYSCPLAYLDMAPEENAEWRKGVRAYHARRNQKLALGQEVKLTNGHTVKLTKIKPLRGVDLSNGVLYRIPRRMLTLPAEGAAA